jgi:phage tail-like protein
MDVNGTRFHLLQGARDWIPVLERHLVLDGERALHWDDVHAEVTLAPHLFRFPLRRSETPPSLDQRRGADCDRYGNLYWIDDDGLGINWRSSGNGGQGLYWASASLAAPLCVPEGAVFTPCSQPSAEVPPRLRGLAVTSRHFLIVGTLAPAGLLVFDLHAGGPPQWRVWSDALDFAPFDLAAAYDGGLWILGRGPDEGETRYWRLDRYLEVVEESGDALVEVVPARADDFWPLDAGPGVQAARTCAAGRPLASVSPPEVEAPIALAALPDGSLLILETRPDALHSSLHRFRDGMQLDRIDLEGERLTGLEPEWLRAHDMLFVPAEGKDDSGSRGELFLVSEDGNQVMVLGLSILRDALHLALEPRFLPMRRYDGKDLVSDGREVLYHLPDLWTPLVEQPRPRYGLEAELDLPPLDGKEPGCVWHRVTLDACIAPGDAIRLQSRAADEPADLDLADWRDEPAPYRRHASEIAYHQPFGAAQSELQGTGTWELLLQGATGRYLQLRLRLTGSGRSTPRLRALRAWYPRFSYLDQYLPAVYRDDAVSASFLDRFLANVEGLWSTLEGAVAGSERLLDSRTAPAEYLDWLAGWLGATLDPDFEESRRRLLIEHAELLFRWRGTPDGLLAMIRLTIDPCPDASLLDDLRQPERMEPLRYAGRAVRIVEHFQTRGVPGVALGDPRQLEQPALIGAAAPYAPSQGPEPLHLRFRAFLQCHYRGDETTLAARWGSPPSAIQFPPLKPEDAARAEDWRAFVSRGLGFGYAQVGQDDLGVYQDFLRQRYRRIESLRAAWQLLDAQSPDSFDAIPLPEVLPSQSARLSDWIGFVSLALPTERDAHRFTVLVPTDPSEGAEIRERRLARVNALVERERPAHTEFESRLFWALFQVGGARLGLDTALGEGSRYVALVLGKTALAEGFLDSSHPWGVTHRALRVLGRDPLTE